MENSIHQDTRTFYHGTKVRLQIGETLEPGYLSNYGTGKKSLYIYFSATLNAAIWGAELAQNGVEEHIYIVEPTGPFEDDPNLTNKKFPGNPTQSYRTKNPLRILSEVTDWQGHSEQELQTMKESIERLRQQGIEATED